MWVWIIIAAALIGGGATVIYKQRGLRNNNPGNIRHGEQWQGMATEQTDPSFITFASPEYGIRAMAKVLKNYQSLYGLNTLAKIAARWAPPNENDTVAYTIALEKFTGIPANQPINVADQLNKLIPGIIRQENGLQPYDEATIARGIALA